MPHGWSAYPRREPRSEAEIIPTCSVNSSDRPRLATGAWCPSVLEIIPSSVFAECLFVSRCNSSGTGQSLM
jgi:hypothetical protein